MFEICFHFQSGTQPLQKKLYGVQLRKTVWCDVWILQISKIEHFTTILNDFWELTIVAKLSILYVVGVLPKPLVWYSARIQPAVGFKLG